MSLLNTKVINYLNIKILYLPSISMTKLKNFTNDDELSFASELSDEGEI